MKKLTPDQKRQFDEQGYVFPFRAFDAERATGYRERIEAYERSANIDANRTLKIKGYLAQTHMVMGQEERKNKAKLEKTQIQMASNSNEYEAAVKTLEETTGRWNKEWKSACDKFQDLEEERLDFTKSSLWTYANIASTVCVSDDAVGLLLLIFICWTNV